MLSGLSVIHRERKACESMVKLEEEMAKIYLLFLHNSPGIPARDSFSKSKDKSQTTVFLKLLGSSEIVRITKNTDRSVHTAVGQVKSIPHFLSVPVL